MQDRKPDRRNFLRRTAGPYMRVRSCRSECTLGMSEVPPIADVIAATPETLASGPRTDLSRRNNTHRTPIFAARWPSRWCRLAHRDKRHLLSRAEPERRDDAPAVVDGLAPGRVIAVGGVPLSLLARFPVFTCGIWVGVEEALGL